MVSSAGQIPKYINNKIYPILLKGFMCRASIFCTRMEQTADAPGDYIGEERDQSNKVDEMLRLEDEMEEMLELETGVNDSASESTRTVATNTTK